MSSEGKVKIYYNAYFLCPVDSNLALGFNKSFEINVDKFRIIYDVRSYKNHVDPSFFLANTHVFSDS